MRRSHNWLFLHARRQPFSTYEEIAATLLAHWPFGDLRTINEFLQCFGSRWSEAEVEAAVWKLVGDAAAAGRLLVDLTEVDLSRTTPLALLDPSAPPILLDPLPSSLEAPENGHEEIRSQEQEVDGLILDVQAVIPGPPLMLRC